MTSTLVAPMTFYHDTRRREAHTGDRVRAWALGRIVVPLADEGRGSARSPPGAPRQTVARQGCDAPRPAPAIDDRLPSRPRGEWRSLMAFATRREEDYLWSAPPPSSASSTTLASGPSRHRRSKGALQAEPHGRWIGPSRQCGPVLRARDARRGRAFAGGARIARPLGPVWPAPSHRASGPGPDASSGTPRSTARRRYAPSWRPRPHVCRCSTPTRSAGDSRRPHRRGPCGGTCAARSVPLVQAHQRPDPGRVREALRGA